jgi:uncharacterized membrane protein
MSKHTRTIALAAGMGCIAGMRSMSAPALLSRRMTGRFPSRDGRTVRLLSGQRTATALTCLAAGEMIADKTPFVGNRTELPSLAGRTLSGALAGAAIAGFTGTRRSSAVFIGAAAALGFTFVAYRLRKYASESTGLPDVVFGLAEDVAVVLLGRRLTAALVNSKSAVR